MKTFRLNKILLIAFAGIVLALGRSGTLAQPADVSAALALIQGWGTTHPVYYYRVDLQGQFIKQTIHYYHYPTNNGALYWKVDNFLIQPNEAHMILEGTPGDIVAYFPETGAHVTTKLMRDADIIAPVFQGMNFIDAILHMSKSSSLKTTGAVNELTLVVEAGKVGVLPRTADITFIIRFDHTGQISEVEQRRLGLRQVGTITYVTFDAAEVLRRMPTTPNPELATGDDESFEKAIEDSIIFFAKERQRQRNARTLGL